MGAHSAAAQQARIDHGQCVVTSWLSQDGACLLMGARIAANKAGS
jgi:hypothetical protein